MTSLTKLVSTISVANAAVVFTNWEASSGFSMKLSEAMNQYRDCVSIADDYQLNPSLCSQSNGLEIVTDMANLLDSYDYSVIIIFSSFWPGFKIRHIWGQNFEMKIRPLLEIENFVNSYSYFQDSSDSSSMASSSSNSIVFDYDGFASFLTFDSSDTFRRWFAYFYFTLLCTFIL